MCIAKFYDFFFFFFKYLHGIVSYFIKERVNLHFMPGLALGLYIVFMTYLDQ